MRVPKHFRSRNIVLPWLVLSLLVGVPIAAWSQRRLIPIHIANSKIEPFGRDGSWVWGMDRGQFILLRTSDRGRTWSKCSAPDAFTHFIEDEDSVITGSDQDSLDQYPFSVSLPDGNTVWITWITHTTKGFPSTIGTAHTGDECESWNVVYADFPRLRGNRFPPSQYLKTQFIGADGWALVFEDPATAMCHQLFLGTIDGGQSWQWPPTSETGNFPPESCPDSRWNFRSSREGWLTHPNLYADYSRVLWRTFDGGQTWQNISAQIRLPSGITDGTSNTFLMSMPGFSPMFSGAGTLGVVYIYSPTAQTVANGGKLQQKFVIYRTSDQGKSWELSKVFNSNSDQYQCALFQDDLRGFACINHDLAYTNDGGVTWSRHRVPWGLKPGVLFYGKTHCGP